jgi:citrate synthase
MAAKGLQNIVIGTTTTSLVEGEKGQLVFRGYEITDLARHATFEEVAYLLWYGRKPTSAEAQALRDSMAAQRALPASALNVLEALDPSTEPMDALRTGVSAIGAAVGAQTPGTNIDVEHALALTAQVATVIAAFHRLRQGLDIIPPRADLDHGSNYLFMITGQEPTPAQRTMINAYLVLLADHGMNASTFTARVVTSTGSDLYSAVTAAIGALKGPLHGGAPSKVLDMLDAIGTVENAETWIRNALARKERLMGFGHRVYKTTDPRAEILREIAREYSDPTLFNLAQTVEDKGLEILHETKPDQRLYTNVEFYSAAVMHAVGLPRDLFTTTFAASRTAGWTAHILEQAADNRLIRPDVEYVGAMGLSWND